MTPAAGLRVLQASAGREWRGGQQQVWLLARELHRARAADQRLVTAAGSELARRGAGDGLSVVAAPWSLALDPRALARLVAAVRAFRPTVLHAHDSHALFFCWIARRLARSPAPRLVATRRVTFPVRRSSLWFRCDQLIAISEAVRHALAASGAPEPRITVVPSGIDPDETRRAAVGSLDIRGRLGLEPRAPLAVNLAALEGSKDQHTLLRAARAARQAVPDLHWALAGEGRLRGALENEARELGVGDRVHLLGYVPRAEALIRESDVLVMSSRREGLGTVVLQAIALGKPVVATRAGGLVEILPESALVPVGDAEALANAVVRALAHPSPVPLPPQFTAQAMARGVLAVYDGLV